MPPPLPASFRSPAVTTSTASLDQHQPQILSSPDIAPAQHDFDLAVRLQIQDDGGSNAAGSIDHQSLEHLQKLAKQIVEESKLNINYLEPILVALRLLIDYLTRQRLQALSLTRIAELQQSVATKGKETSEIDSKRDRKEAPSSVSQPEVERKERRQRWKAAIAILLLIRPSTSTSAASLAPSPTAPSSPSFPSSTAPPSPEPMQEAGAATGLCRLTHFHLFFQHREISSAAIRSGSTALEVRFAPNEFTGSNGVFHDSSPATANEWESADADLVERIGGTLHLASTSKDFAKLECALQFLCFAALSLVLETTLRRESSSSRPVVIEYEEEVEPSSHEALRSPVSPLSPADEGLDDRSLTHKMHRSRWSSSGGIWNLLTNSKKKSSSVDLNSHRSSIASSATATSPGSSPPSSIRSSIFGRSGGKLTRRTRSQRVEPSTGSVRSSIALERIERGWNMVDGLGSSNMSDDGQVLSSSRVGTVDEEGEGGARSLVEKTKRTKSEGRLTTEKAKNDLSGVIGKMSGALLSTSANVSFPAPHLLVRLREQEIEQAQIAAAAAAVHPTSMPSPLPTSTTTSLRPTLVNRLRSYSTVDASILASGFANEPSPHPSSSRLLTVPSLPASSVSGQARISIDARTGLSSMMTNNNSLEGKIKHQSIQFLVESNVGGDRCRAAEWLTYNYFDRVGTNDQFPADLSLGQFLRGVVRGASEDCSTCGRAGMDHVLGLMHAKERISISTSTLPDIIVPPCTSPSPAPSPIYSWVTCNTCRSRSALHLLTATTMFSTAKYLELLLYDAAFVPLPDICSHDRDRLIRCFSIDRVVVEFRVAPIILYELRLPTAIDPAQHSPAYPIPATPTVEGLSTEIKSFYASLYARISDIEAALIKIEPVDDEKEVAEFDRDSVSVFDKEEHDRERSDETILVQDSATMTARQLTFLFLQRMKSAFEDDETDLLSIALTTSPFHLNNARFPFLARAQSAMARLAAWQSKHLDNKSSLPTSAVFDLPNYAATNLHIFPVDSNVVVRNTELSSLIALTLDARTYREEVQFASASIAAAAAAVDAAALSSSRKASPQSYRGLPLSSRKVSRAPMSSELFVPPSPAFAAHSRSSTPPRSPFLSATRTAVLTADPDDPRAFAPCEMEVDFIARPSKLAGRRAGSSILSLRATARQRSHDSFSAKLFFGGGGSGTGATAAGSGTATTASGSGNTGDGSSNDSALFLLPPSATSSSNSQSSSPAASSLAHILPSLPTDELLLEDLVSKDESTSKRAMPAMIASLAVRPRLTSAPSTTTSTTVLAEKGDRAEGTIALSSMESLASIASADTGASTPRLASSRNSIAEEPELVEEDASAVNTATLPLLPPPAFTRGVSSGSGSIIAESLNALWNLPNSLRMRESPVAAEKVSSHIKFKFRDGDTTFRVTSYFARDFENLRQVCGLSEDLFISSLSRCQSLTPSGGKSKSVFLETLDSRFILKELITAWGISERDAFLSFCPALIQYLNTPDKPSLLAKIYGFYTIKIKNTKTGEVERKLDLLVLENLLHSVAPDRQFDLKGITSRTSKQKLGDNTLLDGDWLNGTLENRVLLYSHSKSLLNQALFNDTQFLSSHDLIDYSLLAGINDTRKELIVGLIDTLGVFNLAKLLENKGKTTLAALGPLLKTAIGADEVTVIPPADYAARFRTAMNKYFMAVPEKFSRPPHQADDAVALKLSSVL